MSQRKRFLLLWFQGFFAWVSVMALAGPRDLALSQAWADPESGFGRLVSIAGEWPGWVLVAFCLFVLIRSGRKPESTWKAWRPLAWAVILLALVQAGILTQSIKYFWGRVRFVHLAADLSNYTPFWIPAGVGAGMSFPSGHTAMAFVTAPLPFFFFSRGKRLAGRLSLGLVLLYGGGVAAGRVLYGSHYATDVLFSAGVALLAAPWLIRAFSKARPWRASHPAP